MCLTGGLIGSVLQNILNFNILETNNRKIVMEYITSLNVYIAIAMPRMISMVGVENDRATSIQAVNDVIFALSASGSKTNVKALYDNDTITLNIHFYMVLNEEMPN